MSLIKGRFRTDLKYKAIIDRAIAGDRVVTHVYFDDGSDVEVVTLIAGVRTPRSTDPKTQTPGEPLGDDAKKYIEQRLVKQKVFVTFVGVSSTDVPVVKIYHPAGNISEKILTAGLAEVADWQSPFIGPQGMSLLRTAERAAKTSGKGLWKSLKKPTVASTPASASTFKVGLTIEATIARIVSSDTFAVFLANGSEQLVHLSSIRAPRQTDPTGVFIPQARDFVRKYVGKHVKLLTDALRNESPIVTATLPNGKNLAEVIVFNGYATVIRHRRGDEDRSSAWDSLIEAETIAIKEKRGIHSSKTPAPEKFIEASEDVTRAKVHLRSLKNKGKFNAILDFVISPTRLRITIPSDGLRIVLVLAGVMGVSKESPISEKAIAFNNRNILQRDVTVEVFDVDKFGGFIGNVYLQGKNTPYQLTLLKEGLVQIHEGSLSRVANEGDFYDAEGEAVDARLNIWENYDPDEEEKRIQEEEDKRKAKYEQKIAKFKKPNAFDDDEEEDLSNLPEAVRKLVINR
jgi:staphylococcal nuclease domain-containing protein 1